MNAILTVAEAAVALKCSRSRVFKLLADGVLVRAPKYGKLAVVTATSVEAALYVPEQAPKIPRARKPKAAADIAAVVARARRSKP